MTYKVILKLRQHLGIVRGSLSINQMKWEPINRIPERHTKTSPWCLNIIEFIHLASTRQSLRGIIEILAGFDHKRSATEFICVAFSGTVDKWFRAGAAVVDNFANPLGFFEAEVFEELSCFGDVSVRVVYMG